MSSSPPTEIDSPPDSFAFGSLVEPVCDYQMARQDYRCVRPPYKKERYCVLHYADKSKSADFAEAVESTLARGNTDFFGVWFPDDLDWREKTFDQPMDFRFAVFNGETILTLIAFNKKVDFTYAKFVNEVYFSHTHFFEEAIFDNTKFQALAYFRESAFHALAHFESATFCGEADFSAITFEGVANFGYITCASYLKFSSEDAPGFKPGSSLDLQFANVEKPERVSFNTLALRPGWFVHVDPRKFDFFNVTWPPRIDVISGRSTINEEVESLERKKLQQPHRRLAIAYSRLASNAEENNRYSQASDFRYQAMDTQRREKGSGFAFWTLDWWYWLASGYGESVLQASYILLVLWLLFAVPYRHVGFIRWEPKLASEADVMDASKTRRDDVGKPLEPKQAVAYSFGTMTLQRPEPRPATAWTHVFVILETIFGPVQAALVALAIRRKFMR
jgi:hypothetical protein